MGIPPRPPPPCPCVLLTDVAYTKKGESHTAGPSLLLIRDTTAAAWGRRGGGSDRRFVPGKKERGEANTYTEEEERGPKTDRPTDLPNRSGRSLLPLLLHLSPSPLPPPPETSKLSFSPPPPPFQSEEGGPTFAPSNLQLDLLLTKVFSPSLFPHISAVVLLLVLFPFTPFSCVWVCKRRRRERGREATICFFCASSSSPLHSHETDGI